MQKLSSGSDEGCYFQNKAYPCQARDCSASFAMKFHFIRLKENKKNQDFDGFGSPNTTSMVGSCSINGLERTP